MKTLTQLTMAGALGVALLANSVSAQAPPDGKRPGGNRPDGQPPGGGQPGGFRGGPGDGPGGPGGPGGIDQVLQQLNLTDAQQGKVEAIRQAQQEKMKALNDDFTAKMKGVLNEEQFKKFSEAQQRPPGRQGGGQGGFGGPGGPGGGGPGGQRGGFNPLEQIAKDLNLSAEQQTKFDAARQSQQEKMRGLFQRMQSGELDREGMMAEGAKLREGLLKDLKGILNAEQYAKVEEALKRGPQGGGPPGGGQPGGPRPEGKKRPE